jgi:hypothetical protein
MSGNTSKGEATAELARIGLVPRLLNVELAGAYVGLSAAAFLRGVELGHYPRPIQDGRRKQWDRKALDLAVDRRSGLISSSSLSEAEEMMRAIDAA